MHKSIRILLAIVAYYDYEIWQMDVKTAFLNGHLTEDVYMVQPEGFEDLKNPNKNEDEPCVYRKASGSFITFLILYVDDVLLIGNNVPMLQDVKSWLEAAKEAAWMKKSIADLEVMPSIKDQSRYCVTILVRGDIVLNKVQTDQNLVDPFTKPMPQAKHEEHADKKGLRFGRQWV
ncbi:hypothetical protein L1987_13665 [Smallanthus sonchifolius]|uniref:Uncharacterized protein n=1 Tax=Smallanthus sonchifolius TaxID=185202 RepID=A0ACB9JJG8_9ASTR|nr:hypothetical protein L1987_13665 [Smallanthus sonchifolius]